MLRKERLVGFIGYVDSGEGKIQQVTFCSATDKAKRLDLGE